MIPSRGVLRPGCLPIHVVTDELVEVLQRYESFLSVQLIHSMQTDLTQVPVKGCFGQHPQGPSFLREPFFPPPTSHSQPKDLERPLIDVDAPLRAASFLRFPYSGFTPPFSLSVPKRIESRDVETIGPAAAPPFHRLYFSVLLRRLMSPTVTFKSQLAVVGPRARSSCPIFVDC